jgi:predicted HTH transcriptional regulator
MQPNVTLQAKNIFRVLCGFLNSESGGTLYIGVTDLGYVSGIGGDMSYLRMTELDTYIRFIQDEAAKHFPVDVLSHFIIKPMFGNQVVSIRVEPYMGGIVEFDGKAFIRINNETREMNAKLKEMMQAKKKQ